MVESPETPGVWKCLVVDKVDRTCGGAIPKATKRGSGESSRPQAGPPPAGPASKSGGHAAEF